MRAFSLPPGADNGAARGAAGAPASEVCSPVGVAAVAIRSLLLWRRKGVVAAEAPVAADPISGRSGIGVIVLLSVCMPLTELNGPLPPPVPGRPQCSATLPLAFEPSAASDGGGGDEGSPKDRMALRLASMIRRVASLSRLCWRARCGGPPPPSNLGAAADCCSTSTAAVADENSELLLDDDDDKVDEDEVEWKRDSETLLSNFLDADSGAGLSSDLLNSMPSEATTEEDLALSEIDRGGARRLFAEGGDGTRGLVPLFRAERLRTSGTDCCCCLLAAASSPAGGVIGINAGAAAVWRWGAWGIAAEGAHGAELTTSSNQYFMN